MRTYDFVAIGLGPFNLGLAALTEPIEDLDGLFLEARPQFDWHPGLMLPDATLQVPFLADLVSMADPTSRWSFLNYLKQSGHLYSFYIRESFFPLRREYNDYCRWVCDHLDNVRFDSPVTRVEHDATAYVVHTPDAVFRTRRLVLGTGTAPVLPPSCAGLEAHHAAHYLANKAELQAGSSITVVGSGQSAAEVYADLLGDIESHDYELNWITRSPRFFPLEYTKLTLEMTSPEYTGYFQSLPDERRAQVLAGQKGLYKGISSDLVNDIFDELYRLRVHGGARTMLATNIEVTAVGRGDGAFELGLRHAETEEDFVLRTDGLVLATGYAGDVPGFLDPVMDRIDLDEECRFVAGPSYAVDPEGEVFVQNAELHTHGFVAPDLGMGAYRNSVIIAAMLGREVYPIEKRIAFQEFGVPERLRGTA